MRDQIEMIAGELGVEIIGNDSLDANGYYIAELNLIVINSTLPLWDKYKVLLHELGHASKHNENHDLYNLTFALHSKMEFEANKFMIRKLLKHYVQNNFMSLSEFNYMTFMETYGIDQYYEEYVKQLIVHYVTTGKFYKVIGRKQFID